jgi:hypothetical protein
MIAVRLAPAILCCRCNLWAPGSAILVPLGCNHGPLYNAMCERIEATNPTCQLGTCLRLKRSLMAPQPTRPSTKPHAENYAGAASAAFFSSKYALRRQKANVEQCQPRGTHDITNIIHIQWHYYGMIACAISVTREPCQPHMSATVQISRTHVSHCSAMSATRDPRQIFRA